MPEVLNPSQLLEILEGNRRLTVRTVQAFPEHDLFHYAVKPMRTFAELVKEFMLYEEGIVRGIATGEWKYDQSGEQYKEIATTQELLAACEAVRRQTREWWPRVTVERLVAVEQDQWGTFRNFDRLQMAIENENHHRGQGYVYLRLLGIAPPHFYQR